MQENHTNTLENYSDENVQKIIIRRGQNMNWDEWDRFLNDPEYIYVPKGGVFDDIHIAARILYGILLDKSRYDGIEDSFGKKKINYTINEMAEDMGYHRGHIQRLLKELNDHNLIGRVNYGPQKLVDLYVNVPSMVK